MIRNQHVNQQKNVLYYHVESCERAKDNRDLNYMHTLIFRGLVKLSLCIY